jgi:antitoxin (DNA-binding transcriptional repressor) of toxin-antitoxin stability system
LGVALLAAGLEESVWLCPIEDRRKIDSSREGMLEDFPLGSYLLLVDYTGRLFRDAKTVISSELTGILNRLGSTAESWRGKQRTTTVQTTLAVEDIKLTLPELLDSLLPGDEVILTRNHLPVAKLKSEKPPERKPRVAGLGKGMITIISDDEDHLKDFAEYMP